MGLGATVRCRCFEEGKLKPGPVPLDDLYVDDEGYLASRKLDAVRKRLDHRRFDARYGELEDEFYRWTESCCEHEDGEYCSESVSNVAGCAQFRSLVEEAGGEAELPLLSKLLPQGNGGIYPAEKAAATLVELDRFIEKVEDVDEWVLCDVETDEEVWISAQCGSFPLSIAPYEEVWMVGGEICFYRAGCDSVETTHFKQIMSEAPDAKGCWRTKIICLDTGAVTETAYAFGSKANPGLEREFYVTSKKAPFLYEGKYWTAERIRRLLVASIETGNPIRWC